MGESVKVTANTAVTWEVSSDLIDKGLESATELNFTAKDKAGLATITAKTECDSESITFSIIEPERLDYIQDYTHIGKLKIYYL